MTDRLRILDELGDELERAAQRLLSRRTRSRRHPRRLSVVLAVVALSAAVAGATGSGLLSQARDDIAARASELLGHAQQVAQARDLSCALPQHHTLAVSQASPAPQILAVLGILRRAQTPAEARLAARVLHQQSGIAAMEAGAILPRSTRVVVGPHRELLRIAVQYTRSLVPPLSRPHCQALVHRLVRHFGKGQPAAVLRQALAPGPPIPASILRARYVITLHTAGGATQGPFVARRFRARGLSFATGTNSRVATVIIGGKRHRVMPPAGPAHSTLIMLVPDGVATVTLRFRRAPHLVTRPVHSNVVFFTRIPRNISAVFAAKQIWRDAAGHVVRR